ncbi:MAG TPA: Zn-ribbon domain-containing OB-fold protein [Dehalococcoidia bacterium]|nr:Zn-ribbon domain-containing OB-fold protein [Dehalococcoidia bacterium]
MPKRPLPQATPETEEFWAGARRGELRIQRCSACGRAYFFPRPFCPFCSSRDVAWFTASGRGRLYSYVINYRGAMGFQDAVPYVIAVVELEEGPRMMTNIVGVEPDPARLPLDLPVEVTWERQDDEITLPLFRPAGGAP